MKKKIEYNINKGLPGGSNELKVSGAVSIEGYKRNSPDVNNEFNIIQSSNITMKDVDFPLVGIDNLGNKQIMYPGGEYTFPGHTVLEVPLAQSGEEVPKMQEGGQAMHPFEQWASEQGMTAQEALELISQNPDSYDAEIVNLAREYYTELQHYNPVNDKQDELSWAEQDQYANAELPQAQKGRESRKERKEREEREAKELEELKRKNEERGKQLQSDFEANNSVEINTEGMLNPLRVYPNPIPTDYTLENPELDPMNITPRNYITDRLEYWQDPNSLAQERYEGNFINQYPFILPTYLNEPSITEDWMEEDKLVDFDLYGVDDIQRKDFNEQVDLFENNLSNIAFVDLSPNEKKASDALKGFYKNNPDKNHKNIKGDKTWKEWYYSDESFDYPELRNYIYYAQGTNSMPQGYAFPFHMGRDAVWGLARDYGIDIAELGEIADWDIISKKLIEVGEDPNDPKFANVKGLITINPDINLITPGDADEFNTATSHEITHHGMGHYLPERERRILSDLNISSDNDKHLNDEEETYSDLMAVRQDMLDKGIYDYRNDQMTIDHWQEYLNQYKEEEYPLVLKRMLERYRVDDENVEEGLDKDQNIIYINNVVADSEIGDDIDNFGYAQRGGSLSQFAGGGGYDFMMQKQTQRDLGLSDEDIADNRTTSEKLDHLQTMLTTGGLVPAYGIVPDLVNTAISGGRGFYSWLTGDRDGTTKHMENMAINATSAVPGPVGWTAGGAGLAKDMATYTGLREDESMYASIENFAENNETPEDTEGETMTLADLEKPKEDVQELPKAQDGNFPIPDLSEVTEDVSGSVSNNDGTINIDKLNLRKLNQAKNFAAKWMASPRYQEMLLNSGGTEWWNDGSDVAESRIKNLNKLQKDVKYIEDYPEHPYTKEQLSSIGGYSHSKTGDIFVRKQAAYDGLFDHEVSHSIDRPIDDNSLAESIGKFYARGIGLEPRLIPDKDIDLINSLKDHTIDIPEDQFIGTWEKHGDTPEEGTRNYYSKPTEVRARLNEIRRELHDRGVDIFNKKVTNEDLDFNKIDNHGLLKVFPKDAVLDMINIISDDTSSMPKNIAKFGGALPKAQKGNETIMIMGDAARANEAGLDTEYSDLRGKEKIQDERFPGMYDSTLEAFKEIVKDESPEIQQLLYNTWYNVGRPSIKKQKDNKTSASFSLTSGIKAYDTSDLMEEFGHAYQTWGDAREDTDFWSNPFSRTAFGVMDFLPTTWQQLKGAPFQLFGRKDFGIGKWWGTGLWDWVDDNIVDLDQTSPYKNYQSIEGVHNQPGARGFNWLDGLRTTYDYLKNYSDKDGPIYYEPDEWNKQHTGRKILHTKDLLGQPWGTGGSDYGEVPTDKYIIDQDDLDQYYEEFGIDKDPQLWIYNPNFDYHSPGNTFGDYPFQPWDNSHSTERYLDYYGMDPEKNLNNYDLNYWGVKRKGGSTDDDLIQPVLNEDGSVKTVKYGTKEYKDAYNAGELAEWRSDESHPDGGYWTRWLPEVTLTDTSPETDWINNKINNPSWMSRLLGRDPGKDWMGVDWERSLHNPYYNQRQYDTNPIARAVMDKTGQTPGSSPFGGTWADVVSDAPLYSAIGVPAISTLGVYAPGVLGTTIPGTGGSLTIGGGLNLAGGAYSGYHLPGDVQDFAKDPSLRTGANVGLDLLGLGFGGYEALNMASKFKFSPLLKNTTNLRPSYSGITEKTFGPEDIILAKEANTHGYNYSTLANSRLADLQRRMQTDEFRLRMKGLIDEEIIGPGKLFTTRPVTEAGKVNQYELLVNNTIDDMIADALKMRIVNTTDDLGYFMFDNAGMKTRIPGSIQKGLPRIALNKNLPYNSTANIPVTDHEIGHFFQSGISDYLPYNIGKIHPKHFDNPHIRQTLTTKLKKDLSEIYPQYTGKTGVYNTDIDRAIQKNLRIDPEYRLGDLSKPANYSFDWRNPGTMSSRQVDHVLRNLGETEGLKNSYNYFARRLQPNPRDFSKTRISSTDPIGTSKEGLPYLNEIRADMLQRGFIKNTYDEITPFKINSYLKALSDQKNMLGTPGFTGHYTPRLTQLMAKDADNINYLSKMLNKLPVSVGIGTTPFLLDEQSRNPTYQEGGQIYGPSETSFIDDDDDGLPVGIDRYDKPYEVLFEDLEKGIRWAESKNGELMRNEQENSTATGLYGQRFSEIEKGNKNNIGVVYEGTRDDFEKDIKYQKKLFHDLAHKKSGLIDNGRDLYEEYYYQIKDLPYNATELGALSNMLGRQGTRKYLGYVLRDGKSLEEVFPTLYGSGKIVTNKTPEVYIKEFNEGILKLKRGGDPIKRRKRLWQQLKKHRKGEKISGLAKLELKDRGLIKEEKNNLNLKHINADGDITFGFEYDFKNTNLKKVSRGGESDLTLNQQIKFYEDYVNSMYDGTRNFKKAKSLFEKINRFYLLDAKKDNSHVLKHMKKLRKAQVGGTTGDLLSWMNPYNYEGWFDMYPTIKADNFQDAFATAQKEHADSEYFLYRGKRYINELKGESKHHQPTQDILDRIQNSETLDQSVKDNFMSLWNDLNQPYLNIGDNPFGPKGRDHVDSWSKGRPNLYIKDYNWHKRDDKQLIVDIINELTHVKQHNDMGRRKYLTKYLGELIGEHGHQHNLYDKEGTLEYAAHAGDIRPALETYVFGEPISEIGSREAASVAPYQIDPEKVDKFVEVPEVPLFTTRIHTGTEEVGEKEEPTYKGIMGTIGNIFGFQDGGSTDSIPNVEVILNNPNISMPIDTILPTDNIMDIIAPNCDPGSACYDFFLNRRDAFLKGDTSNPTDSMVVDTVQPNLINFIPPPPVNKKRPEGMMKLETGGSVPQWFKDSVYNIPINQGFLPTVDVGPRADATKYYEERLPYYNYLSDEQKQHLNDVYLGEVPESPIFDNIIGQGREGYGIGNNPTYMESVHDFAGAFPTLAGKNLLETLTIPQATLVEGIEAARGNPYNFKNVFPSVDRNLFGKQRFPSTTFLQDAPLGWQIAGDIAIDPVAIFGLGKLGQLGVRSLNTAARNRKLATTLSSTMDDALTTPTNYNTISRPVSIFDGANPGFGQSDELLDDAYKAIGSSGKDKIYSTSQIGDLTVTNASKNLLTDMSNAANTGKFVDNSFPQIGLVNGKLNTPNKTQITKFDDALNTAFDYKGMEDGTNVALTRIIDSKGLAVENGKLTFKIAPHIQGSKEALKIQRYDDIIKKRNTTHFSFSHVQGDEYHSPHFGGNWRNKSTAVINNINDLKKHGELLNISPSDTYFYTKNNMFVGDQAIVLTRDKKLYDNITKNAPKTNIYYVGKNVTDDQFAEIVNSFHRHAGSSQDKDRLFHNYVGNELVAGRDVGRFKVSDKEHYLKDFSSNNPSTFSGGPQGHDPTHGGTVLNKLERAANFKNLKYIGPQLKSHVNPSGKLPSRKGKKTDLFKTYEYPYSMSSTQSPGNIMHQAILLNKYIPYPEMKQSSKVYNNWLYRNSFENLSGYPLEVQINEIEKLASSGFDTNLLNKRKEWLALDNGFDTWTDMVAASKYSTMKRKGGEANSLKQY